MKAYSEYLQKAEEIIPLVITDYKLSDLKNSLSEIKQNALNNHVHLTGYVSNHLMPMLYNLCTCFLYPSMRESFGIPILEAMKCGKPVITSNTSSMPEISGGNAILVDPANPDEISEAMIKLLNNNALVQSLVQQGFEQAARFSWKKMAEDVLEVYKQSVREK